MAKCLRTTHSPTHTCSVLQKVLSPTTENITGESMFLHCLSTWFPLTSMHFTMSLQKKGTS